NIIKKVSGQKFVYKFVSYPEIGGIESAREEAKDIPEDPATATEGLGSRRRESRGGWRNRSSRNEYMRSGLYSTFTIQSLRNVVVLLEPPADCLALEGSQGGPEVGVQSSQVVVLLEPSPSQPEEWGGELEPAPLPTSEADQPQEGGQSPDTERRTLQKTRKPRDLELGSPGHPGGQGTPVLLTPSALPPTIHFWSTLSPIAPLSPAKLFQ
ncbi:ETS domain-containing protein Elk-1-like, partial [Mustelus asterias]